MNLIQITKQKALCHREESILFHSAYSKERGTWPRCLIRLSIERRGVDRNDMLFSKKTWNLYCFGGDCFKHKLTCHSNIVKTFNTTLTADIGTMVPLHWSIPHTRNKCTVTQPKACSSMTLGVSKDSGLHLDPLATLRHSTEANNLFMRMWWMMTVRFFLFSLECLDSFQNTVLTILHIWDIKRAALPQRWQNSLNSPVLCYYHSKWSTAYITREHKGWTLTTKYSPLSKKWLSKKDYSVLIDCLYLDLNLICENALRQMCHIRMTCLFSKPRLWKNTSTCYFLNL